MSDPMIGVIWRKRGRSNLLTYASAAKYWTYFVYDELQLAMNPVESDIDTYLVKEETYLVKE